MHECPCVMHACINQKKKVNLNKIGVASRSSVQLDRLALIVLTDPCVHLDSEAGRGVQTIDGL